MNEVYDRPVFSTTNPERLFLSSCGTHGILCSLGPGLFDHMIYYQRMFVLGTEHNDLGILVHFHVMTCRPEEQVPGEYCLLKALGIGGGDLSIQHITPVMTLALVSFQADEQGSGIHPCGKAEVLPADLPVSGGVAKVLSLPDYRSRDLHFHFNVVFCYFHNN